MKVLKQDLAYFTFFPIKSVVGSYKNVSRMVMRASSFCLKRPRAISHVLRNGPKVKDEMLDNVLSGTTC
jgi:hypothetical protein